MARSGYVQLPDPDREDRGVAKLGVALLLIVTLAALFGTVALYQTTSQGVATRALRRSLAALTEIDPLIDRNYDDLQQRAAAAPPDDQISLRDYPMEVPLTAGEAMTLSKAELRATLLARSSDEMYRRGIVALRVEGGAGSSGVFNEAGLSAHVLDFLRARNHDILRVLTIILAAVSCVLAAILVLLCRGFGRLVAIGSVVVAAALPLLLFGFAWWLYLRNGGGGEYTREQFAALASDLAWIPMRDGLALAALGASMLLLGAVLAVWSDRRASGAYEPASFRPVAPR